MTVGAMSDSAIWSSVPCRGRGGSCRRHLLRPHLLLDERGERHNGSSPPWSPLPSLPPAGRSATPAPRRRRASAFTCDEPVCGAGCGVPARTVGELPRRALARLTTPSLATFRSPVSTFTRTGPRVRKLPGLQ